MGIRRSSGALWTSTLGLPVVVARANTFVPIIPRGHTQTFCTALVAKEQTGFLILSL